MTRRVTAAAMLIAALALSSFAAGTMAQDPIEPVDPIETEDVARTTTGTVVMVPDADGRSVYYLDTGDGELIELSYGPSWFWGLLNPLDALVGTEVAIGGNLRDGMPNEHASEMAKEKAAKAPRIKVLTIDGERRAKGKPAWAGGPKVVGEVHPGHDGWSKGQAAKPARPAKPAKPEGAAKP